MSQSPKSAGARSRDARLGALVVALVAALALAGCGRKAGLDPPPMAAAGDVQPGGQAASTAAAAPTAADSKPVTPPPDKRKTLLDWLID